MCLADFPPLTSPFSISLSIKAPSFFLSTAEQSAWDQLPILFSIPESPRAGKVGLKGLIFDLRKCPPLPRRSFFTS